MLVLATLMPLGISWANEFEEYANEMPYMYEKDINCSRESTDIQCACQDEKPESNEPKRRALPAPFASPPFPSAEYQGSPLVGVPPGDTVYPLMKAIYSTPCGEAIKKSRIKAYGWVNASGNLSTCKNSNTPDSYWIVPNRF